MRSRNYLFTLFVPDEQEAKKYFSLFESLGPDYIGCQLEECPTSKRPHLQGFIQFPHARSMGALKKAISPALHLSVVTILRAAAINYGCKEETRIAGPWEAGVKPSPNDLHQKTDWEKVKQDVLHGRYDSVPAQILISHGAKFKAIRTLFSQEERLSLPVWLPNPWGLVIRSQPRKKRHYWLYSTSPNLGKTHLFAKPVERVFRATIHTGPCTYWRVRDTDECVLLDDFNAAILKWYELNQLCDGTYIYNRKYQEAVRLSDPLIIVLSNQSILDIYPNMNSYLYARFNEYKLD